MSEIRTFYDVYQGSLSLFMVHTNSKKSSLFASKEQFSFMISEWRFLIASVLLLLEKKGEILSIPVFQGEDNVPLILSC